MVPAAQEAEARGLLEPGGAEAVVRYVCATALQPGQQSETLSQGGKKSRGAVAHACNPSSLGGLVGGS